MAIATLKVSCSGAEWTVRCHAVTWNWSPESRCNELFTLSTAGPETAMKSIRALLVDPQAKPEFRLTADDNHTTIQKSRKGKFAVGYLTKMAKLDRGAYHLVAISKSSGIIPDISEDRLWETLTGRTYSTPLLRHWMPEIMHQLKTQRLLEISNGFNGAVGVLDLEPDTLDDLVSNLVRAGQLQLTI